MSVKHICCTVLAMKAKNTVRVISIHLKVAKPKFRSFEISPPVYLKQIWAQLFKTNDVVS